MADFALNVSHEITTVPARLDVNLKHMDKTLESSVKEYLEGVKDRGVHAAETATLPHKDTGALFNSFKRDSYSTDSEAVVRTTIPYASFIDGSPKYGTKLSAWPNVKSLREWVGRKLKSSASTTSEVNALTYQIGASLFKRKVILNPSRFMEAADEAVRDQIKKGQAAVTKDAIKAINK